MNKNLLPKTIFVLVLVLIAVWILYPPHKTLKPGIDLAGGTSLIYEINTQGLQSGEERDLAQRMITVLRRRIDPADIQNLVWRPQGNTRFEIQMPLASQETRVKRDAYQNAMNNLLNRNVSPVTILQSLKKSKEQRDEDFARFAQGDPNRLEILNTLAQVYEERKNLQEQRDRYAAELTTQETAMKDAGIDVDRVKSHQAAWSELQGDALTEAVQSYGDPNLITSYIKTYGQWADAVEPLTDPETGKNAQYIDAVQELDKLNLTEEQITSVLNLPAKSQDRIDAIEQLKTNFPDRGDLINQAVVAFDEYRPFQGRLDDPADLQRMLKGAGILEFRILPTSDGSALPPDDARHYIDTLSTKGPRYASDSRYVWCEIEDQSQDAVSQWVYSYHAIVGEFGKKYYVLASNQPGESMLHTSQKGWRLERANPTTDSMGRRAIGFSLDDKGAVQFANLTGDNIDRPLCILLDGVAISAPNVNSAIIKNGIIQGSFTETEVADMVNKLNAGSLPARLIEPPISVKTIGPSIGAANRDQGIEAGIIGLFVVMLCMLVYYLKAGAIADVALIMNILFVLSVMAGVRATFTLPGIAGIILTIGMSVDANVLIFERIREEQDKGASMAVAVKNGYDRAFRTIFDANLTTFITGAILYWVASEEVKGFAIVLMLGIVSSMFTALFVTRVVFDWLLSKKLIKDQLVMLRLIHQPNINWMGTRPVFFVLSSVLIIGGMLVFWTRNDYENNKYDIEFTGGTSVQVDFKNNDMTRDDVENRIHAAGKLVGSPGLETAHVYSVGDTGKEFEITTTETNKTTSTLTFTGAQRTVQDITKAIRRVQANRFSGRLSNLRVTPGNQPDRFVVATSQVNAALVKNVLATAFPDANVTEPTVDEIVNNTIHTTFEDELEGQNDLGPEIASTQKITESLAAANPVLANSLGGIMIDCTLQKPTTVADLRKRFEDLRYKPDLRNIIGYPYRLFSADLSELSADQSIHRFVYVSLPPDAGLRELEPGEWTRYENNEIQRIKAAASLETSLPRVTQIDPSVGSEQKTRALIAIILSLSAIVAYVWVRFGDLRYGLAAIVALVHDVCITLGVVAACYYIANTSIGRALLVGDFKINLAMIAAFLTLIGYSLNDTIVVFDRIRENRHKAQLTAQTITTSINQTMSRTLLTSFTTFIVVLIMYIFGGEGLRGFTFAIGLGIIVGTYSSIAIAAPILLIGNKLAGQSGKK